jgi:hypothetical protein
MELVRDVNDCSYFEGIVLESIYSSGDFKSSDEYSKV